MKLSNEIKSELFILSQGDKCNDWEKSFISSIINFEYISEKQNKTIQTLYRKYRKKTYSWGKKTYNPAGKRRKAFDNLYGR